MNYRVFVVKKEGFRVESESLLKELKERLGIESLQGLLIYNIYDIFGADEKDLKKLKENILSEKVTDNVLDNLDLDEKKYIAYENLPGQYDQRADSAMQCFMILNGDESVKIKSGKLIVFEGDISEDEILKIKDYLINPVENREKDLNKIIVEKSPEAEEVKIFNGFIKKDREELEEFREDMGLAMSQEDLIYIQEYFITEDRDPTETEILVLDTYWSDHCRHTTFETEITDLKIEEGKFKSDIEKAFQKYLSLRSETGREEKEMTLMDMATIVGRYFRKIGKLEDQEVSDEINACSIEIEVDEDGEKKPWLLMFKNETHNHPTEIEPFGGAGTCVGGAIRDPLSGRSYVYQAMRVTGAGDITKPIEDTLPNKLPQSVISKTAADGYSSYGNQIGLAATYVREFYHDGFVAKRMELGAVVGAAPKENVVREKPEESDLILLIGGDTGRDGVGGATGSSVEHTDTSLTKASSEVQKGNAPVERRIQRLFRNPKVSKMIKKSNDFGAGGVSVAIGELADGLDIDLNAVPVKYEGLSGTELAISESQERMAIVIDEENLDEMIKLAFEENLNAVLVAKVTGDNRLVMRFNGEKIVDLSRDFLNTNGVRQKKDIIIKSDGNGENPFIKNRDKKLNKENLLNNLKDLNTALQKGLVEKFDSTIGRSTVLMPYGGLHQLTETDISIQKLPTFGFTKTASAMTVGYNPYIATYSPYLGAVYSVIEALAKLVAAGVDYKGARLTNQEYFEKLGDDPIKWGKPAQALLGLVEAQEELETPSIGGKDSMSGTYNELDVPPTLITFAVKTEDVDNIISPEFKEKGNYIYLIKFDTDENHMPDFDSVKKAFRCVTKSIREDKIISASVVKFGGIAEAIAKMTFGNKVGASIKTEESLFDIMPGAIIVESKVKLDCKSFDYLGMTTDKNIDINGVEISIDEAIKASRELFKDIYPIDIENDLGQIESPIYVEREFKKASVTIAKPKVMIPVFPGSNSEYDTIKAFENAGAEVETYVLNNLNTEELMKSMRALGDKLSESQILAIVGGFSLGDEPDGSGKFIANVLQNEYVKEGIFKMMDRDGLILGICNGFQALVKSGLLPYADMTKLSENSPTLFKNNINRHVSKVVKTRISSNKSPWMSSFTPGEIHSIIISHGEGRFIISDELAQEMFAKGQIAAQYVDEDGIPTMNGLYNANSSQYAIESISSEDGRILGKMGHSERYEDGLLKNIYGNKEQDIFKNGVNYFK
ncbi:MAG: phosphoribosylformylglycinamidine synthase [Tissierellia bacterium]|nr:phosphoribosylformylglycinamidine synthase [Tissierellia bacterium]